MEDTPTDFFSSRFLIPPPRTPTGLAAGGDVLTGTSISLWFAR